MLYRCPNCKRPLDQLGAHDPQPDLTVRWTGENLWRCQDCPYGSNRFVVANGKPEKLNGADDLAG